MSTINSYSKKSTLLYRESWLQHSSISSFSSAQLAQSESQARQARQASQLTHRPPIDEIHQTLNTLILIWINRTKRVKLSSWTRISIFVTLFFLSNDYEILLLWKSLSQSKSTWALSWEKQSCYSTQRNFRILRSLTYGLTTISTNDVRSCWNDSRNRSILPSLILLLKSTP